MPRPFWKCYDFVSKDEFEKIEKAWPELVEMQEANDEAVKLMGRVIWLIAFVSDKEFGQAIEVIGEQLIIAWDKFNKFERALNIKVRARIIE